MRRVLLVKTSSMGDVVHMLSAVREAQQQRPEIRFDWVCEEAFVELPRLLTNVDRVIPVATRRWRKSCWRPRHGRRFAAFWPAVVHGPMTR